MRTLGQVAWAVAIGLCLTACGSEAPTLGHPKGSALAECVDGDGDGFGQNCDPGPDCDDDDATLWDDCGGGAGGGGGSGAQCNEGQTKKCKVDLGEHNGVKSCFIGTETCVDGAWGPCQ
jgi:hypothetical protein